MSDLDEDAAFRELPYYKSILKSFFRKQIGTLLEEMAVQTGEESVVVMVNASTGTVCSLGSSNAKQFVEAHTDIKTQFLSYCLYGTTNEDKAAPKSTKRKQMSGLKSARMPKQSKCFGVSPSSMNIFNPDEGHSARNTGVSSVGEDGPVSTSDRPTSHTIMSACQPLSSNAAVDTDKPEIIENSPSITSQVNSRVNLGVSDQRPPSHIYALPGFMNIKAERLSHTQMSHGLTSIKTEPRSDVPTTQGLMIVKAEPTSDAEMSQDDLSGMNVLPNDYTDVDGSSSHNSSVEFPQTFGPIRFVRKFPPKERTTLSLPEKINIIQDYESGETTSQRKLADKYNISKSAVADMLKNRQLLKEHYEFNANTKRKRFNTNSRFADINEVVWQWFRTARESGIQMSGPMIQEKALQVAQELQVKEFKGSNGWLHSWKSRYNVTAFRDDTSQKQTYINDYSKIEGYNSAGQETANAIMNLGYLQTYGLLSTSTSSQQVNLQGPNSACTRVCNQQTDGCIPNKRDPGYCNQEVDDAIPTNCGSSSTQSDNGIFDKDSVSSRDPSVKPAIYGTNLVSNERPSVKPAIYGTNLVSNERPSVKPAIYDREMVLNEDTGVKRAIFGKDYEQHSVKPALFDRNMVSYEDQGVKQIANPAEYAGVMPIVSTPLSTSVPAGFVETTNTSLSVGQNDTGMEAITQTMAYQSIVQNAISEFDEQNLMYMK